MKLNPRLRQELKKPFGRISEKVEGQPAGRLIVCVGDKASKSFVEAGMNPKIIVYDGLTMRQPVEIPESLTGYPGREVELSNEPGTLNKEAFKVLEMAFGLEGNTKILVDGEEDLVTLAAIRQAPEDALIVYGQPNEGLVYAHVDRELKDNVESILEEMSNGD